jgi:hypothetical protein
MIAKIFLGIIMILAFIMIYPYMINLWTDNISGFNVLMNNITNVDGSPAMSEMEKSIWGLFPLMLLVLGVGGIAWLIVREKDR